MDTFTKAEFQRRVKLLVAEARRLDSEIHTGCKIEIHERTHPVSFDRMPTIAEAHPAEDDLYEFATHKDSRASLEKAQLLNVGGVVHIAISIGGDWGYLIDTVTGWLGTNTEEPVLITHNNGF